MRPITFSLRKYLLRSLFEESPGERKHWGLIGTEWMGDAYRR